MERLRATPESYGRKLEFLRTVIAEKAHEKFPNIRRLTQDGWVKIKNIGAVYNGASGATLQSIADQYGITRQQVSIYCKKFMEYLWMNCSRETQEKYPLETLPFAKPISQASREKFSLVRGGISIRIKEEIEKGTTDPREIAERLGLSKDQMRGCRTHLRGWGLSLETENRSYQKIEKEINKETDDKKLQELLDSLSDGSIRGFIEHHKKDCFMSLLGNTLREMGFSRLCTQFVADVLKSAGILIRYIKKEESEKRTEASHHVPTYYVFLTKHKQRVRDAIRVIEATGDKRLRRVDVELICGNMDQNTPFPSTFALTHRYGYRSAGNLLKSLGIRVGDLGGLRIKDILSGCPTPVFRYGELYFFPSSKIDEFRVFVEEKWHIGDHIGHIGDGPRKS